MIPLSRLLAWCLVIPGLLVPTFAQIPARTANWSVDVGLDSYSERQGLVVSPNGPVHLRGYLTGDQRLPAIRTFQPTTGQLLWEYVAAAPVNFGTSQNHLAVSADGTLFTHLGSRIFAFEGVTGRIRWQFDLESDVSGFGIGADGTLYVEAMSRIHAFNPETGLVRWSHQSEAVFEAPFVIAPNGNLYYAAYNGSRPLSGVWSLDPGTGTELGHYHYLNSVPGEGFGPTSLIPLRNGNLMVGQSNYFGLDSSLTSRLPSIPGTVAHRTQPIETTNGLVLTGVRYFGPRSTALFGAYDAATGAQRWSSGVTNPTTAALAANGTVYVVGNTLVRLPGSTNSLGTPVLYALSSSTGQAQWVAALDRTQAHAPILSTNGMLYVRTTGQPSGGTLHAFGVTNRPAPGVWAMDRADAQGTARHPKGGVPIPPLAFDTHPQDLTVGAGSDATFRVVAQGVPPLFYTWFRNDRTVPAPNLPTLTLTNVTSANEGSYFVVVSNLLGGFVVSRTATLRVTNSTSAPLQIVTHPLDLTVLAGTSAAFSVVAEGTAPLFYTWLKNGRTLPAPNLPTLTLNQVTFTNAGAYSVVVSNLQGRFVVSRTATLTVLESEPIRITLQPQNTQVARGETAFLRVEATGPALLTFAWERNGVPITSPSLAGRALEIPNVSDADLGTYVAIVSSATETVRSNPAILSLRPVLAETWYFDPSLGVSDATGPDSTPGDVTGPAPLARFSSPNAGFVAPNGDLYVADTGNHRVKKLTPDGQVVRVAGSGTPGRADGPAATAEFRDPIGLCVGPDGTVYVADYGNHLIRTVSPEGIVATLAGSGTPGLVDGTGANASFNHPSDLALAPDGFLFVTDFDNHAIRRVSPSGEVVTWSGSASPGTVNGFRTQARFNRPAGIAVDAEGTLWITQWGQPQIRRLSADGQVSTFAGTGEAGYRDGDAATARFREPDGIVVDAHHNLFITDRGNHVIRRLSAQGLVQTVAGSSAAGARSGNVVTAEFSIPSGIGMDSAGTVYVADTANHRVRRIPLAGLVSTYELLVLADAPTGYWRLGNGDAFQRPVVPAVDQMNRHPGTYAGEPAWTWLNPLVSPHPDLAASFHEDRPLRVEIPRHPGLSLSPFSLELWARLDATSTAEFIQATLASCADTDAPRGWILRGARLGEWELLLGTGTRWITLIGSPVRENEWTHLVATYDGQRARLYVNGVAVAGRATPFAPSLTGDLRLGPSPTEPRYTGALDEAAYYPRALSPQHILAHYGAALAPEGITARLISGRPTLVWFSGRLVRSPTPQGPWVVVPQAVSPFTIDSDQAPRFYRTLLP
ncbi:MAG: PQQ-binding-like beta-propeller repeat protein [Verrucomicrobiales bacterium]|nr:PQQ-binding-like beta-propeller repeat protein [Verrucomicrobiales bacterium]